MTSTQNTEQSTHKITTKRVELRVTPKRQVPVKLPKLPPAEDAVRHKIRVHIACVIIGGLVAVLITYVSGGLIHYVPFLPTLPNVFYEVMDRIYDR